MARSAKIGTALLCIVCVLALCIAPYVDIPVTALKSLQIALLLMLSLVGCALLFLNGFLFFLIGFRRAVGQIRYRTLINSLPLPFEINCVQQC